MSEMKLKADGEDSARKIVTEPTRPAEKRGWQTPKMEDVSEQVMAQPYIRFT
ncbi:MAG: hypothetical protein KGJ55_03720 [Gammaproteobacteria bacterium]|nr:hypothetical protein [Gammaproteobacteria bacterium]